MRRITLKVSKLAQLKVRVLVPWSYNVYLFFSPLEIGICEYIPFRDLKGLLTEHEQSGT